MNLPNEMVVDRSWKYVTEAREARRRFRFNSKLNLD